jgi:peroxiredoxin
VGGDSVMKVNSWFAEECSASEDEVFYNWHNRLLVLIAFVPGIFGWAMMAAPAYAAQSPATSTRPSLSLTVLSPKGEPAAGALAVLVPPDHSADVTDGRTFDDDPAYVRAATDGAGRLSFVNPPIAFLLVVIDATGSLQLDQDAARGKNQVKLTAWGRIGGQRYIGDKPAAGHKVIVWASRGGPSDSAEYDPHVPTALFISNATVDSRGNYQIDRMSPGEAYVAPNDPTNWGAPLERPMRVVTVHPGASTTLDIGGRGRAVIGRVVLPLELSNRHDWTYWLCTAVPKKGPAESPMPRELEQQPLAKQIAWWSAFNQSPEAKRQDAAKQKQVEQTWAGTYPFDIQDDGTFRIDDIEPGTYDISFHVLTKKVGTNPRTELAAGNAEFTVDAMAGGRTDDAIEVPPISVEIIRDVQVGDAAPDFTVMGLDDRPLQLSKFRGKYVLLQFWATWCGPCVVEMDNVKAVYDKFGKDDRFAMISLSSDQSPDRPAHFAAAHGLTWHQGFLGGEEWDSPIQKLYAVKGIPSIWLIGPDGKVIRKNLRGEELLTAVGQALSQ